MTYNFVWMLSVSRSNNGVKVSGGIVTECEDLPQCGPIAPYVTLSGELEGEKALRSIPKVCYVQ